ncbi:MAG: Pth [Dehalococcoidia bacterium]|nr:Pth [Dehalococcoidia bacterium]
MKLIVGLGNPGSAYASSRHNVGFRCIEGISRHAGIPLSERRRTTILGQGKLEGEEVVLAKPRTFMNNSGEAVSYLLSRFPTPLGDLLIIYDDMDLPLGKVRIRPSGSAGGHRGMESIVSALGSVDFPRIRVGIGRPPPGVEEIKHVLGPFTAEENPLIQEALVTVRDAVIDILANGLDWAMNRYN